MQEVGSRFRILACLSFLAAAGMVFASNPLVVDLASDTSAVRIDSVHINDIFGESAAGCDLNGDGIGDLVVGAKEGNGPNHSRPWAGEVYVFFGRRGAWHGPLTSANADVVLYGEDSFDNSGDGLACGDLNGDGTDDILIGAPQSCGPGNTRPGAGTLYIVFGRKKFPSSIDLGFQADTVVHGAVNDGQLAGTPPAVGDLNGDGLPDLAVAADYAPSKDGTVANAGRTYLFFGHSSWPPLLDIALDTDVTIYGKDLFDGVGANMAIGDLDGDGTEDLLAGGAYGDGLGDRRKDCGEINVFRGKPTWPQVINLTRIQPDMLVFGPDPNDHFGSGITLGDIDGDGHPEAIGGVEVSSGRNNTQKEAGEVRVYEPYPGFPTSVDLATQSDSAIYGAEAEDHFGDPVIGRFDGDAIDDLIASSRSADGPGNGRPSCGEIYFFPGRAAFPIAPGADRDQQTWTIYGGRSGDQLTGQGKADINGDGVDEIVASIQLANSDLPSSVYLISPIDIDGDGITQLPDNCPLVYNPDQLDADGDGRGDACATDWDGDGQADGQDCAPADPLRRGPSEAGGIRFAPGSKELLQWDPASFTVRYDLLRGDLPRLSTDDYGACQNPRDPNLTDTQFLDPDPPATGRGFFYLVRGRNDLCPTPGTLGLRSDGTERVNNNPAACP